MNAPRRLIDDCFLHDKDRLRHNEVLELLGQRLSPIAGVETIDVDRALNRIAAGDVVAPRNIPDFTNAAIDGYAFAAASLGEGDTELEVSVRIQAGTASTAIVGPGEAARIFTGAAMPAGTDTCVMQEDAVVSGMSVRIPAGVKHGINVRGAGEDVGKGDRVVDAGSRLRPQDMAILGATGTGQIEVFKQLRVAVFSTGDEVVRPGSELIGGQVYDSNHYLLSGLLAATGVDFTDLGILADDKETVGRAVKQAAAGYDVILTTGGASRGEADYVVETVQELGALHAWQLAIKPGRPLVFGQISDTVFVGLPGNPVAAFVCFLLYVQPVLAHLQGASWRPPQRYQIPAGFAVAKKKPGRREFLRGWVERDGAKQILQKFARDGSGLISGLTSAHGLIEIGEEVTSVEAGDLLNYIPFTEFGLNP